MERVRICERAKKREKDIYIIYIEREIRVERVRKR